MEMIRGLGWELIRAASGDAGIAHLESGDYGLVLGDTYMPERNGFAVFEEVHRRWPNFPFVFMTGYSVPAEEKKIVSGAAGILEKAVKTEKFWAMVASFWQKTSSPSLPPYPRTSLFCPSRL